MKAKFSLFILAFSLLFFSCGGGLSQEGTGSVTMDAGRVAQHLARSAGIKARDVGSNFDGHGRDMDMASLYSLSMTVKLSTIGDYSASAQEKYKITMEEMAASDDAMESFFKTSLGKPITIEEIPVGSRIKVKAEVSFGQEFDEDAYRKILKNSGMPDAYINEALEGMKREVSSNMTTAEGYSQEFTVKSGTNNITVKMAGDDFGDFGEGFEEDERIDFTIILYESDNDRGQNTNIFSYTNGVENDIVYEINGDEDIRFINYCKDRSGYMYVFYKKFEPDLGGVDRYYIYSDNPKFTDNRVILPMNDYPNYEAIAYDYEDDKLYVYYKDGYDLYFVCLDKLISNGSAEVNDNIKYIASSFYNYQGPSRDGGLFHVNNKNAYILQVNVDGSDRIQNAWIEKFDLTAGTTLTSDDWTGVLELYNNNTGGWYSVNDTYFDWDVNKLYLLVSSKKTYFEDDYSGGIVCVDLTNREAKIFLAPESDEINALSDEENHVYNPIPLRQPEDMKSREAFFCPSKIIGINPKRLVIADDGHFIYVDGDKKPYFKNVNRIVMVNLEEFPITINHVELTDVNFGGDTNSLTCGATGFEAPGSIICGD